MFYAVFLPNICDPTTKPVIRVNFLEKLSIDVVCYDRTIFGRDTTI